MTKIILDLPLDEARALAQFVKRTGFDDCKRLALSGGPAFLHGQTRHTHRHAHQHCGRWKGARPWGSDHGYR